MRAEAPDPQASRLIDARILELDDWRGETLAAVRAAIHDALPFVVEEWKWRGVPVWSHDGIVCTGEACNDKVRLTFPRGAALSNRHSLFNAALDGKARRAIDLRQGDQLNLKALKELVRDAAHLNELRMSGAWKR